MTIKPIKTERDYRKTLKEIEKLWNAKPNTPMGDRLDVLVTLVEAYEQKHYRINPPDPIEAIKFRMEQLELKPSDLAKILGGRSRVSEVLNKKRKLAVEMDAVITQTFSHSGRIVIGVSVNAVSQVNQRLVAEGCSSVKYPGLLLRICAIEQTCSLIGSYPLRVSPARLAG
jgi:HTH-type transcriptional regulator / antitoxin HigA